jgi:hypothetical protein
LMFTSEHATIADVGAAIFIETASRFVHPA